MNKETIVELQSYFDGRSRLSNAIQKIKLYSNSKDASIFFGYVDGFKNKRTINIPIEPDDLLPILEKYVRNIESEIMGIAVESTEAPPERIENPQPLLGYRLSEESIPPGWEQNIRESIESALSYYNASLEHGTPGYEIWNEITDQSEVWEVPNCFIVNDLGDESADDMLLLQITNPNEVITSLSKRVPVIIILKFINRLKG